YNYRVRASDAVGNASSYSPVASAATPLPPSGAPGLVAAYSFNEGSGGIAADSSGNGNTGSLSGATWTTAGHSGNALNFNGTGAWVIVNDSSSLDLTGAMTLEAWVNPTALGGWRDVVYKGQNDIYYLAGSSDPGPPAVRATYSAGSLVGTSTLPLNTWSHLAG